MNAIETQALSRAFGSTMAVDRLSLSVQEGEVFALLGVNGAGKTTLIRLLCGQLLPTSGSARVFSLDIRTQMRQIKPLLGVSPQETAVAGRLTVLENLRLMADLQGAQRDDVETVMEMLSLGSVAQKRAHTLSGGWMRRLSIAMALVHRPRLLFLDEPTLGLDVLIRRELWQVIRSIRERTTVVLTTHYLEEAEALSDRIAMLSGGRLTALGTAQELMTAANVTTFEDAFVHFAGGEGMQ